MTKKTLILNASPRRKGNIAQMVALKEICRYSGFKIVATIEKGGTRHDTTLSERERNRCRKAVRKLL